MAFDPDIAGRELSFVATVVQHKSRVVLSLLVLQKIPHLLSEQSQPVHLFWAASILWQRVSGKCSILIAAASPDVEASGDEAADIVLWSPHDHIVTNPVRHAFGSFFR